MARVTVYVQTYLGSNPSWPGTSDNPMRPELFRHPVTGEVQQAHYNSRNLITDSDYKDAGFRYFDGKGWCFPVQVDEDKAMLYSL